MNKKNGNSAAFGFMQKFGQALLVPVALLPAGGLLYGFGIALKSDNMLALAPWLGTGIWPLITQILSSTGSILFSNLAMLFAVGVAIGLAKNHEGTAGLAAVAGYFLMNQTICTLLGLNAELVVANTTMYQQVLGIYTLRTGVFGGIFVGLIAAWAYNRFHRLELPQYLAFFQAKRSVPIIVSMCCILLGAALCVIWPPIQNGLTAFSNFVLETNPKMGVFLYGMIIRLLNPLGLHTAFYTPFFFQFGSYVTAAGELVTGDKAIFFAQMADGVKVTGGIFTPGAFVMDMIACVGGSLAIYHTAKPERKKMTAGILISATVTSMLTGITEPWIFSFLFVAPVCFFAYTVINGLAYLVCYFLGVHTVSGFACGIIDFILFDIIPGAPRWYLVIPVGIVFGVLEYVVFRTLITKLNYKTPGREDGEITEDQEEILKIAKDKYEVAKGIIEALGGKANIESITCCATRLRVTVSDDTIVKKTEFTKYGAKGLSDKGKNLQIIMGVKVGMVLQNIEAVLNDENVDLS